MDSAETADRKPATDHDQAEIAHATRAMVTAAEAAMDSAACSLLTLNCRPLLDEVCAVEPVESGMFAQSGK